MANNEIHPIVSSIVNDWQRSQTRDALTAQIATLETELEHRLNAAPHLRGIPQLQNATSINKLYDLIVDAHIQLRELS